MGRFLTTGDVINMARAIHGDKYDYSLSVYSGMNNPFIYRCPKHGIVTQKAFSHIHNKAGCPDCTKERMSLPKTTKENFISKAKCVHGSRYDYSKVDYQGVDKKVCIICSEHGEFWQTPWNHIKLRNGCPDCAKNKKLTFESFVSKARQTHGDKYDYSKVDYVNSDTDVCIICPTHGEFQQRPSSHIRGSGCPKCAHRENDGLVRSRGIKPKDISSKGKNHRAYTMWVNMLERTTPDSRYHQRFPTYIGCKCSDEWLSFDNFLEWYKSNGGIDNPSFVLDKDILFKGNKLYSKDTCCLVPPEINRLVVVSKARRGDCPLGVTRRGKGYGAQITECGKRISLGVYKTKEEAFEVYTAHKYKEIERIASVFYRQGDISERIYNALINYRFNYND